MGMDYAKRDEVQEKYIAARLEGKSKTESALEAGYSPKLSVSSLEAPGTGLKAKLDRALAEKGIDENFLLNEILEGMSMAKKDGAKEKDLNSHVGYTRQIQHLLGHGKATPSVAVQINQGVERNNEGLGPEEMRELIESLGALASVLKEKVGHQPANTVYDGDIGTFIPEAHSGVDQLATEGKETGSGGQP